MRWHVTYTVAMGKHGNQRIPTIFGGTEQEVVNLITEVMKPGKTLVVDWPARKAFPVENILLIEWSESK